MMGPRGLHSFFVGGFLYIAIGMVCMYKLKGQTGVEAVPNIQFWRDLPGLLKVWTPTSIHVFKSIAVSVLTWRYVRGRLAIPATQDGVVFSGQKIKGLFERA